MFTPGVRYLQDEGFVMPSIGPLAQHNLMNYDEGFISKALEEALIAKLAAEMGTSPDEFWRHPGVAFPANLTCS